jgi:hypothetical protein
VAARPVTPTRPPCPARQLAALARRLAQARGLPVEYTVLVVRHGEGVPDTVIPIAPPKKRPAKRR